MRFSPKHICLIFGVHYRLRNSETYSYGQSYVNYYKTKQSETVQEQQKEDKRKKNQYLQVKYKEKLKRARFLNQL